MASFHDYLMDKIKDQINSEMNNDFFRYAHAFKYTHASNTPPKTDEAELKLIRTVDMRPKIGFEDFKIVDLEPTRKNGDIIWKAAADTSAV